MQFNQSLWETYQPGYVHPDFVPYQRTPLRDEQGNVVMTNTWAQEGTACQSVNPALIRKNWRTRFALKFAHDPCPVGFVKGDQGYCFPKPLDYEPIMYTDKAFIPKYQYWDSYVNQHAGPRRVSESFDMRSVNPLTGKYSVYYLPVTTGVESQYGLCPTSDSYL